MWKNICLFNDEQILQQLRPITDHRDCWELLIGTSTLIEKWQKFSKDKIQTISRITDIKQTSAAIYIMGTTLPTAELLNQLNQLPSNTALFAQNQLIAFKTDNPKLVVNDLQKSY